MQYAVDVCYGIQSGVKVESWIYKILLKQREYCFFKITWTAVDFHSDCYAGPGPSHWQYSDVTRRDWPAQIIDNNVAWKIPSISIKQLFKKQNNNNNNSYINQFLVNHLLVLVSF